MIEMMVIKEHLTVIILYKYKRKRWFVGMAINCRIANQLPVFTTPKHGGIILGNLSMQENNKHAIQQFWSLIDTCTRICKLLRKTISNSL